MDTSQLETRFRDVEERVEGQFRDATRKLRDVGTRVEDLVREHPGATLAGAFILGYLLARAARRA